MSLKKDRTGGNLRRFQVKPIAPIRLNRFQKPLIDGNRGSVSRTIWYVINALFFQSALLGLIPSWMKACILRSFGAKVGKGFVCKPRVSIKYPWFLEIGDYVWIGEGVWIDNHCLVTIGSNSCISQGAFVFTGNHDWGVEEFRFFCEQVEIGDHVWITAFTRVGPGSKIPNQSVVW